MSVSAFRRLREALDRVMALISPEAALRLGLRQQGAEQKLIAFRLLLRAANARIPEGLYQIGRCYLFGNGVPANRGAAIHWLEQAGDVGHTLAQETLARLLIQYSVGSAQESGILFQDRRLTPNEGPQRIDFDRALHWARRAAESGSADSQAVLGYILTEGPDHLRDLVAGGVWYQRSAQGDSPHGALGHALRLARMARCPDEHREIARWLRRAVDAALPTAFFLLGVMTDRGVGLDADKHAAVELFRRGAQLGSRPCQARWGQALYTGYGVPANPSAGETWLRKAGLAGDPHAAALVGNIYARGGDLPPNFLEASIWFRRAAELGHTGAARALGDLYARGAGVEHNVEAAGYWLERARTNTGLGDAIFPSCPNQS